MLILASNGGQDNLYDKLLAIKRKYVHSSPHIESYFYICNPDLPTEYEIVGDIVYVKTEENYPYLWKKFLLVLKAFEHRLHEFDFIARPNLSSFFIIDRYLKFLENSPRHNFCGGLKFYGRQPIPFPSGFLFTITPDIAKFILATDNIIPNDYGIDDRCVGVVLQKLNIEITQIQFIGIEYPDIYESNKLNKLLKNENCFLIRIRHLLNEEKLFGTDIADRPAKDLSMHCALLQKFYNVDDSIYDELSVTKNLLYTLE